MKWLNYSKFQNTDLFINYCITDLYIISGHQKFSKYWNLFSKETSHL